MIGMWIISQFVVTRVVPGSNAHAAPVRIHTSDSATATKTAAVRYPTTIAAMFRSMRSG